jgi:hypothetical protein
MTRKTGRVGAAIGILSHRSGKVQSGELETRARRWRCEQLLSRAEQSHSTRAVTVTRNFPDTGTKIEKKSLRYPPFVDMIDMITSNHVQSHLC